MKVCNCPVGTYPASVITNNDYKCPSSFGQTQKFIFWRAGNTIASIATGILSATWATIMSAVDDTKGVITPYVAAPVSEVGAAIEFGSGNEVVSGIPVIVGKQPTKITATFLQLEQSYVRAMKELECEDLEVILVNELGQLGHLTDAAGLFKGVPISSLLFGDKNLGGFEIPDSNTVQFNMAQNWSDWFTISEPTDFNPLTLLNS